MHANAVEVDSRLRSSVEEQLRGALAGLGRRIGHVHVRLYGETGEALAFSCYVRVDFLPRGGVARGASAADLGGAVAHAVARVGVAVRRELG